MSEAFNDPIAPVLVSVDEETRQRMHADAARAEERLAAGVKLSALAGDELEGLASVREMELFLLLAELRRRRSAATH